MDDEFHAKSRQWMMRMWSPKTAEPRHRRAPGDSESGEAGAKIAVRVVVVAVAVAAVRETMRARDVRPLNRLGVSSAMTVDLDDEFEAAKPSVPAPPVAAVGRSANSDRSRAMPRTMKSTTCCKPNWTKTASEGHAHRKIPTWQDTVGVLIDGNMSMRSERPETRGGQWSSAAASRSISCTHVALPRAAGATATSFSGTGFQSGARRLCRVFFC